MLLEHTVGNLDPLYIVNKVPYGLEIPRLRDRLVKVITDYRTETSLRNGCNDILKADCVNLLVKYYKEARHGIYLSNEDEPRSKRSNTLSNQVVEKSPNLKTMEVKSKTRGGARCCICFDPFSIQNVSVIAFFCCHAYHTTCLMDSSYTSSSNREIEVTSGEAETYHVYNGYVDDDSDDEETNTGGSRMRCILCTTAAS
ncbi:vacuolar protein sorting-associated protein 41-like protein [Senna tora]|uniref:Vacuolar protein sorting-associated protein 41-like protein n=1 Tax=Senna tora TaxID=362788 RepID=A0A834SKT9_9FABA|nr:vacuolar protein sorting-associated protein 41-like protein [Senna tora]